MTAGLAAAALGARAPTAGPDSKDLYSDEMREGKADIATRIEQR